MRITIIIPDEFYDRRAVLDQKETQGNVVPADHVRQAMNNIFGHEGKVTVCS